MRRAGSRIIYFARTALRGLAGSPVTSIVAVVTIGVSLVLVGAFALLLQNMEELLDRFGDDLHVTAFLEAGLSEAQRRELLEIVRTVEGVEHVRFVSEAEAFERFRAGVGSDAAFLEGLDENPLPASLEITLLPQRRSAAGMRMVVESLTGLAGIDDLSSGQDWVEGYLRAVVLVRGLGIGLGAILALATLLIVANTIRLAVFARRDELEILSLVGASRPFIATPFLVEGAIQGALGGVLAVAVLYVLFRVALPEIEAGLTVLLGFAEPRFLDFRSVLSLIGAGAFLGLVGSAAAVIQGLRK